MNYCGDSLKPKKKMPQNMLQMQGHNNHKIIHIADINRNNICTNKLMSRYLLAGKKSNWLSYTNNSSTILFSAAFLQTKIGIHTEFPHSGHTCSQTLVQKRPRAIKIILIFLLNKEMSGKGQQMAATSHQTDSFHHFLP